MNGYFITNEETKDLSQRLIQLIRESEELKFLVGFFYFSGIQELYEGLKSNPNFVMKVLVGLDVDKLSYGIQEYANYNNQTDKQRLESFINSIKKSINSDQFDNKEFYEQVKYFIELIKNDRLIIGKTLTPNHAKLYLFKLNETQVSRKNLFITGSSNLTRAGMTTQEEFNVEISDFGFDEAEKYFDGLWKKSVKITGNNEYKKRVIDVIENETLIKQVTPFEAYALILKTYLQSTGVKDISTSLIKILNERGYKPYKYQLDAVKIALSIIEKHNGVLIADVVGLGKTIIACMIAKHLKCRGLVVCPPGLMGDKNKTIGWEKYLNEFQLYDWEVRSLGDLETTLSFVQSNDDIEAIIVDEAHRFRNQDTRNYELLKNICRNKKVILLTATPFNNKPEDVLSLLNLFIIPKKSSITLSDDLISDFRKISNLFDRLAYIKKNYQSNDPKKLEKAKDYYEKIFNEDVIDIKKVNHKSHQLAKQIRAKIEPITIRRNRLDLVRNPEYKDEVKDLSVVEDPKEWFYELSEEQSKFYDEIITKYFSDPDFEGGLFKGAIYRPFEYEKGYSGQNSNKKRTVEENREYIQQRNLFDIMRRLIIKRFESSFGAFEKSIINFKRITEKVLEFIEKTGDGDPFKGEYILDRDLLEKIVEKEADEIFEALQNYEKQIAAGYYPKKHKRYKIEKFVSKEKFINDIKSDIKLFDEILKKLKELKLLENDPKAECLVENLVNELQKKSENNEPKRKIVIFSEYADTVEHVFQKMKVIKPELAKRTLVVSGDIPQSKLNTITKNFDASVDQKEQKDEYDILLSTDKLSEGFNLNRAGMVINYDIPWNPVRVIQRLGRINRISKKVFDKLYIINFFPTEKGAEFVKSREIAGNKMFMIHKTLGEDSKIFDPGEEPSPSKLYDKLLQNPDESDEESTYTKILNHYLEIEKNHPEIVKKLNNLPKRIKVMKKHDDDEMIVCFLKNGLYIKVAKKIDGKLEINDSSIEMIIDKIKCTPEEKALKIDDEFWNIYKDVKDEKEKEDSNEPVKSLENKALNKIDFLIKQKDNLEISPLSSFLLTLKEDLIDYGTLPLHTIRRLAMLKTEGDNLEEVIEELESIKNELGEDYLEKVKKNLQQMAEKEIIIAVMNKKIEMSGDVQTLL